jgi:hypothetical protein
MVERCEVIRSGKNGTYEIVSLFLAAAQDLGTTHTDSVFNFIRVVSTVLCLSITSYPCLKAPQIQFVQFLGMEIV